MENDRGEGRVVVGTRCLPDSLMFWDARRVCGVFVWIGVRWRACGLVAVADEGCGFFAFVGGV